MLNNVYTNGFEWWIANSVRELEELYESVVQEPLATGDWSIVSPEEMLSVTWDEEDFGLSDDLQIPENALLSRQNQTVTVTASVADWLDVAEKGMLCTTEW